MVITKQIKTNGMCFWLAFSCLLTVLAVRYVKITKNSVFFIFFTFLIYIWKLYILFSFSLQIMKVGVLLHDFPAAGNVEMFITQDMGIFHKNLLKSWFLGEKLMSISEVMNISVIPTAGN